MAINDVAVPVAGGRQIGFREAAWRACILVVLLWFVLAVQYLFPSINHYGIHPRSFDYPQGWLLGHFLHAGPAHLLANSWALLVLSAVLMAWSTRLTLWATVVILFLATAMTWLFGDAGSVHLGASGLVFGYFGLVIANGLLRRSFRWALFSGLIALLYGGSLWIGMTSPGEGISWPMHSGGFIGGLTAAWILRESPRGS